TRAHVAGVTPLRAGAVLQGRRDEPGHRAAGLLLAGARGEGLPRGAADWHADRLHARALAPLPRDVRFDHPVPAPDLDAGVASSGRSTTASSTRTSSSASSRSAPSASSSTG